MARGNKKAAAANGGTGTSTPKAEEAVQAAVDAQTSTPTAADKSNTNGAPASNAYTREFEKRLAKWSKKKRGIEAIEAKISGLTPQEVEITKLINNDERKKLAEKPLVEERVKEYQELANGLLAVAAEQDKGRAAEKEAADAEIASKVEEARKAGYEEGLKAQKEVLLTCFRFLRLAGYRRAVPGPETPENLAENEAIEKVLIMVYSSEESATAAIEDLAASKDEPVEGSQGVTYARIKEVADNLYAGEEELAEPAEETTSVQTSQDLGESTVIVTEADAETTPVEATPPAQTLTETIEAPTTAPAATSVDDAAANAAAVSQTVESTEDWDHLKAGGESSNNGASAQETPAHTVSWADQSHEESNAGPAAEQPAEARFQPVQRGRGRGRGGAPGDRPRGGYRGRGEGYRGRGEFRGGDRGNFRGRGSRPFRPRGDRGGYQAPAAAPAPTA